MLLLPINIQLSVSVSVSVSVSLSVCLSFGQVVANASWFRTLLSWETPNFFGFTAVSSDNHTHDRSALSVAGWDGRCAYLQQSLVKLQQWLDPLWERWQMHVYLQRSLVKLQHLLDPLWLRWQMHIPCKRFQWSSKASCWILFGWDGQMHIPCSSSLQWSSNRCRILFGEMAEIYTSLQLSWMKLPTTAASGSSWVRWADAHTCSRSLEWSSQQQLLLDPFVWDRRMHILAAAILNEPPNNSCCYWILLGEMGRCTLLAAAVLNEAPNSRRRRWWWILLGEIADAHATYFQQQSWMKLATAAAGSSLGEMADADTHACRLCHKKEWRKGENVLLLSMIHSETRQRRTADGERKPENPQKERKETLGSARARVVHHPESWQSS